MLFLGAVTLVLFLLVIASICYAIVAAASLRYGRRNRWYVRYAWDQNFLLMHIGWIASPLFGVVMIPQVNLAPEMIFVGTWIYGLSLATVCFVVWRRVNRSIDAFGVSNPPLFRFASLLVTAIHFTITGIPGWMISFVFAGTYARLLGL